MRTRWNGEIYGADLRKMETTDVGRTPVPATLFLLLFLPVVPGPASVCCTESEDPPRHVNSVNLSQQQLVVHSFHSFFFFIK